MVLRFFLLAAAFFLSCTEVERDNPYDSGGKNYMGEKPSSSSSNKSSSSFVLPPYSSKSLITYGPSVDYGGETYKSVVIGPQTWMARNLNYAANGSKCYGEGILSEDEIQANCDKYGRLYDWATAKSICSGGWHIPSKAEWEKLWDFVDIDNLRATSWGNGTDKYGFAALPGGGGGRYNDGSIYFGGVGDRGFWWSANEGEFEIRENGATCCGEASASGLRSVRCLQN
ncbi:MAG: hypothetical protein LBC75_09900 [Fibromonadaceae bacterium]|jgi:uncharacterized protein (TIGR02145 family)|nr:hypothetical protein [Fibromonadaceae bacterium]